MTYPYTTLEVNTGFWDNFTGNLIWAKEAQQVAGSIVTNIVRETSFAEKIMDFKPAIGNEVVPYPNSKELAIVAWLEKGARAGAYPFYHAGSGVGDAKLFTTDKFFVPFITLKTTEMNFTRAELAAYPKPITSIFQDDIGTYLSTILDWYFLKTAEAAVAASGQDVAVGSSTNLSLPDALDKSDITRLQNLSTDGKDLKTILICYKDWNRLFELPHTTLSTDLIAQVEKKGADAFQGFGDCTWIVSRKERLLRPGIIYGFVNDENMRRIAGASEDRTFLGVARTLGNTVVLLDNTMGRLRIAGERWVAFAIGNITSVGRIALFDTAISESYEGLTGEPALDAYKQVPAWTTVWPSDLSASNVQGGVA